jgi:hypothetical protein
MPAHKVPTRLSTIAEEMRLRVSEIRAERIGEKPAFVPPTIEDWRAIKHAAGDVAGGVNPYVAGPGNSSAASINDGDRKWCSRRRHYVASDHFDKNQSARDGLQTWCKDCTREHNQGKYRDPRNPLEQLKQELGLRVTGDVSKVCRGCTRNLPKTQDFFHFRLRKGHKPHWYPWCKDCRQRGIDRKPKAAT